jgi:CRISPR-associated exonuclease Cas4
VDILWALSLVLLAVGLLVLWLARRTRAASGLPPGRIIAADMGGWKRLEQPLFSAAYGLTGRPDYLVANGSRLVPVEVKSGRAPEQPYPGHILQLGAYCLLVEECYGQRPVCGIIRYADRAFEVDYTPGLRAEVLATLECMRADLARGEPARSHEEARRCARCGYLAQCDQGLA